MAQLTPEHGQRLRSATSLRYGIGGAESNVAMYLAALGFAVEWLGRVGVDPLGDRVVEELERNGVGVSYVQRDAARRTGVYFKENRPVGPTQVWYYRQGSAASAMTRSIWRAPLSADHVHLTGITAALSESCSDLVRHGLDARPVDGAVYSFDVNYRPALMIDSADLLLQLAQSADVVFVGLDEAQAVWGVTSVPEIRKLIARPTTVVVKDSERGATAFVDDDCWHVSSHRVDVIEPVGAGDAFAAGYLAGVATGRSPAQSLDLGHRLAVTALRTLNDVGQVPAGLLAQSTGEDPLS